MPLGGVDQAIDDLADRDARLDLGVGILRQHAVLGLREHALDGGVTGLLVDAVRARRGGIHHRDEREGRAFARSIAGGPFQRALAALGAVDANEDLHSDQPSFVRSRTR